MRRSQRSNPGTANSIRHSRSQSTRNACKTEIISKFFKKPENVQATKDTKAGGTHDCSRFNDDDFVEPKPPRKLAKIFTDTRQKSKSKPCSTMRTRSSKSMGKVGTNEEKKLMAIAKTSDVDMEQLQLAIALSKSVEPKNESQEEEDSLYPSTQQIVDNVKHGLLQYQFTSCQKSDSGKAAIGTDNFRTCNKKSKYRFTKPLLYTRNDKDREMLIQKQISKLLLPSNCIQDLSKELLDLKNSFKEPYSTLLQEHYDNKRRIFNICQQTDNQEEIYYVEILNIDKSQAKMGHLLKNWDLIVGREQSPPRDLCPNEELGKHDALLTISKQTEEKCITEDMQKESSLIEKDYTSANSPQCSKSINCIDKFQKDIDNHRFKPANDTDTPFIQSKTLYSEKTEESISLTTGNDTTFYSISQNRCESPDLFDSSIDEENDNDDFNKMIESNVHPKQIVFSPCETNDKIKYLEDDLQSITELANNTDLHDKVDETYFKHKKYENIASASLLSNLNVTQELLENINSLTQSKTKEYTNLTQQQELQDQSIDMNDKLHLQKLKNTVLLYDDKSVVCERKGQPNRLQIENLASVSMLSHLNANDSNISDGDLTHYNEVDSKGICYYESFCEFDENPFNNSFDEEHSEVDNKISNGCTPLNANTKLNSDVLTENIVTTKQNNRSIEPGSNDNKEISNHNYKVVQIESDILKLNNSIENSICEDTEDSFNSIVSNKTRISDYVHALLNSNTFVKEFDGICIENHFDTTFIYSTDRNINKLVDSKTKDIEEQQMDEFCQKGQEIEEPREMIEQPDDVIDLSQDEVTDDHKDTNTSPFHDSLQDDDDCIDLSQDSNDETRLNENIQLEGNDQFKNSLHRQVSFASSISTNESICISDEELNYSCLNASIANCGQVLDSRKSISKKSKFALSDSEDEDINDENNGSLVLDGSISVDDLLARLKSRRKSIDCSTSSLKENQILLNVPISKNASVIIDLEDDDDNDLGNANNEDEDDKELQEALRLSVIEATKAKCQQMQTINENNVDDIEERHEPSRANEFENDGISDQSDPDIDEDNVPDDVFDNSFPSIRIDEMDMEFQMPVLNESINENLFKTDQVQDISNSSPNHTKLDYKMPSNRDTLDLDQQREKPSSPNGNRSLSVSDQSNSKENEPDEFDILVNCSSIFNKPKLQKPQDRRIQELINSNKSRNSLNKRSCDAFEDTFANLLEQTHVFNNIENIVKQTNNCKTPPAPVKNDIPATSSASATPYTPKDGLYVKTTNVTPMMQYEQMTTPEIHEELDKIGVKRLKRRRGVQMLQHVYNAMHLKLQQHDLNEGDVDVEKADVDTVELSRPNKRRKKLDYDGECEIAEEDHNRIQQFLLKQDQNLAIYRNEKLGRIEINEDISNSEPIEEMIFERKQSKRIASCALPFHIAWHNFLCVNRAIWENVLLYEPLQVEILYAMFKELGFKYHVQDMISFFDKKCITIRIKQN